MERLEREPYLFWNLTYESEGFQLSGKMVVDNWTSTKKPQQQYRSLPPNSNVLNE